MGSSSASNNRARHSIWIAPPCLSASIAMSSPGPIFDRPCPFSVRVVPRWGPERTGAATWSPRPSRPLTGAPRGSAPAPQAARPTGEWRATADTAVACSTTSRRRDGSRGVMSGPRPGAPLASRSDTAAAGAVAPRVRNSGRNGARFREPCHPFSLPGRCPKGSRCVMRHGDSAPGRACSDDGGGP